MDRILVATDLSARSDRAVRRAAMLAKVLGAKLDVVHVIHDDLPDDLLSARVEETRAVLREMVGADSALAALEPDCLVEAGRLDAVVPGLARMRGADLLVVGTDRSRGIAGFLGTPTLARLLRAVDLPVLVAAGRPEADYRAMAVGWDFSPACEAALSAARTIAPGVPATLVHAWEPPVAIAPYGLEFGATIPAGMFEGLEQDLGKAAAELGPDVSHDVSVGPPSHILLRRASEGADLLVVGQHARSGLARLILGATADSVALNASCDVLIAPPD